jgi:hypothetical protein
LISLAAVDALDHQGSRLKVGDQRRDRRAREPRPAREIASAPLPVPAKLLGNPHAIRLAQRSHLRDSGLGFVAHRRSEQTVPADEDRSRVTLVIGNSSVPYADIAKVATPAVTAGSLTHETRIVLCGHSWARD